MFLEKMQTSRFNQAPIKRFKHIKDLIAVPLDGLSTERYDSGLYKINQRMHADFEIIISLGELSIESCSLKGARAADTQPLTPCGTHAYIHTHTLTHNQVDLPNIWHNGCLRLIYVGSWSSGALPGVTKGVRTNHCN